MKSGFQEHFYMEPQCGLAVPSKEDGEMIVYASTQNPTEAQRCIAHALNVPMNRVVVKVSHIVGN
jgi:xanthine dehydrogenase molybdopterin-binding subunit B